jgi:hypothetical protein
MIILMMQHTETRQLSTHYILKGWLAEFLSYKFVQIKSDALSAFVFPPAPRTYHSSGAPQLHVEAIYYHLYISFATKKSIEKNRNNFQHCKKSSKVIVVYNLTKSNNLSFNICTAS